MYALVLLGILLCALQCHAACSPEVKGVNQASINAILNKHNQLRAEVANGQQQNLPQAANMLQLIWDSKVAAKAQQWAEKCNFAHDTAEDRDTGRGYTGQNIAYAQNQDNNPDWNGIIQLFYDEVKDFDPNTIDKYAFNKKTGHFTQLIWAKTVRVGCGYIRYKSGNNNIHLYGCNYLPGGNIDGQPIYAKGSPCSQCGGCGTISGLCNGS